MQSQSDEQCEMRFGKSKLKRKRGYPTKPKMEVNIRKIYIYCMSQANLLSAYASYSLSCLFLVYEYQSSDERTDRQTFWSPNILQYLSSQYLLLLLKGIPPTKERFRLIPLQIYLEFALLREEFYLVIHCYSQGVKGGGIYLSHLFGISL